MNNPKVTVLMTIYNDIEYLKEAIDSILNQTFQDFEILIVNEYGYDDGSIAFLGGGADSKLRIIQNSKKEGFANSLNIGLKAARGEYIARMDGDDISLPERFEKQVEYLDKHKDTGIVSCWYKFFGNRNNIYKGASDDEQLKSNTMFYCQLSHSGSMFRKSMFEEFNLQYDVNCPIEDHDLWSKAIHCFNVHIIPEVLLLYRWNENNISKQKYEIIQNATIEIVRNNLKRLNIEIPDNLKNVFRPHDSYFMSLKEEQVEELTKDLIILFNKIEENNKNIKLYNGKCLHKTLCKKWSELYKCTYVNKDLYYSSKYCNRAFKRLLLKIVKRLHLK